MRIRLDSVGCRLNIGEIEAAARRLSRYGHHVVEANGKADLVVLNTCAVTGEAVRKSRHLIRRIRRLNPNARIVVTGCFAELEPGSAANLGADLVVGNDDKDNLLDRLVSHGMLPPLGSAGLGDSPQGSECSGRTRAFLKVQDGCDYRCAYCIVTTARGRGRSRPAPEVIDEVRDLIRIGYREVVLTGVHLGSYGNDLGRGNDLERLIRSILAETSLERLRLSSLEPWDLDDAFFTLFKDRRVLPHLHLPLQSGCDATLDRMARRTTVAAFRSLVAAARCAIPDLSVSTDVMVAFPGETAAEFAASLATVEELSFSRLHVFKYSRRPGTPAASMPHQIPGPIAAERSRRMQALGDRLARLHRLAHLGRCMSVLWETFEADGSRRRWSGLTDNYIRVYAETDSNVDLANRIADVTLIECLENGMLGTVDDTQITGNTERHAPKDSGLPVVS